MINYLLILFILVIFIFSNCYTSKKEHLCGFLELEEYPEFLERDCDKLYSKDGVFCAIPPTPLYPKRCYRVRKTKENPLGIIETLGNDIDCDLLPSCETIGNKCDAPNITALEPDIVRY